MSGRFPRMAACRGFWCALVCFQLCACGSDTRACTGHLVFTPSGTIGFQDGALRVPDRVYVYYSDADAPLECEFAPPASETPAKVPYSCPEGPPGPATLSVLLDDKRWDEPFTVEHDGCHALPQTIDLLLE